MKIHPLRRAYCQYIRQEYGHALYGDKNPERTERIAQQIHRLGIPYTVYVEVACGIYHRFAKSSGWPYPYWNAITSDNAIERVQQLIDVSDTMLETGDRSGEFAVELAYAMDYMRWIAGTGKSPRRIGSEPPVSVQIEVAEYICDTYGVPFVTSNYKYIARSLAQRGFQ